MISFPNAKINLGLNVVIRRPDGFHNIETVFYPIPIKDALEFVECSTETNMHISGIPVDGNLSSNLVYRAYELLSKDYSLPSISVYLQKNIPLGAGLGGGSADAAFMLKMLNDKFDLGVTELKLEDYAAQLGSDCPFFIQNKPVFASGRGEVFDSVNLSLAGFYLVLVKPNIHVSTQEAYAGCVPAMPNISLMQIIQRPITDWKSLMYNDFEVSVFKKYPEIEVIKQTLYDKGAIYASMSGSGSSVFGIFNNPIELQNQFANCFYWSGDLS